MKESNETGGHSTTKSKKLGSERGDQSFMKKQNTVTISVPESFGDVQAHTPHFTKVSERYGQNQNPSSSLVNKIFGSALRNSGPRPAGASIAESQYASTVGTMIQRKSKPSKKVYSAPDSDSSSADEAEYGHNVHIINRGSLTHD